MFVSQLKWIGKLIELLVLAALLWMLLVTPLPEREGGGCDANQQFRSLTKSFMKQNNKMRLRSEPHILYGVFGTTQLISCSASAAGVEGSAPSGQREKLH